MRMKKRIVAAALALMTTPQIVDAHHSYAMFDMTKQLDLKACAAAIQRACWMGAI